MIQGVNGSGPLIFAWINEICAEDTEKRALLVAMGNDLAYVVQAVVRFRRTLRNGTLIWQAPNFVWKTTKFPAAVKGYEWSLGLSTLLSESITLWYFESR